MKRWCLFLTWVLIAAPLNAEETGGRIGSTVEAYRFGPGDVIDVTVSSHTGYDRTLTVQPDGRVQVPFVGEMIAQGRTAVELAGEIQTGLTKELVDPRVTVSLRSTVPTRERRISVSILGAVRNQGNFDLAEKSTLAELLAAAGGALPGADLAHISIARPPTPGGNGTTATRAEVRTVDLSMNGQAGLIQGNVPLASGDLVIVPAGAAASVLVTGQVGKPGAVTLADGARLLDILSLVGGVTPRADLSQVRLTRAGQTRPLDLRGLTSGQEGHGSVENPVMQPGDSVTVPESTRFIYLLGAVARPDTYPVTGAERIFDLLTQAGGTTPQADLGKAVLIRRGATGEPQSQPLDLRRMMTKGDMKSNLPLQPGDVLVVPAKGPKGASSLRGLSTLIWPFTSLFNFLR